MNVLLSAEVLCEAGARCDTRTGCRGAAWCGGALCGILLLFNEALLRGPMEARQAELPMVLLLRGYGKAGFYLSAAVLYLAVITTLFAVLRAQRALAPDGRRQTLAGAATLLAFDDLLAPAKEKSGFRRRGERPPRPSGRKSHSPSGATITRRSPPPALFPAPAAPFPPRRAK